MESVKNAFAKELGIPVGSVLDYALVVEHVDDDGSLSVTTVWHGARHRVNGLLSELQHELDKTRMKADGSNGQV